MEHGDSSQSELISQHQHQPPPPLPRTLEPAGSMDTVTDFKSTPYNGSSHRLDRSYSRKLRRRLVYKNGECNISHTNIKKRRRRYLADIFTTLVDIKWRWNLLLFIIQDVLLGAACTIKRAPLRLLGPAAASPAVGVYVCRRSVTGAAVSPGAAT